MRGFFFLLLLTNVVFLVWQYQENSVKGDKSERRESVYKNKGLTPLSDLPTEKRPALREGVELPEPIAPGAGNRDDSAAVASIKDEGKAPSPRCGRISGLDKAAVIRLRKRLAQAGAQALQTGSSQMEQVNYWVLLPPYRSRDKATEAASILKQHRIRDFFIVRSGEQENAVSLGVFSTRERANNRLQQIVALKARLRRPEITLKKRKVERFWLGFEGETTGAWDRISESVDQVKLGELKEIACK